MKNPYEVLGISPNATDDEVKRAWRELARKYHPDKYRDSDLADLASEKMKEINAAYDEIQKMRASGTKSQAGTDGQTNHTRTSGGIFARIRNLINANQIAEAERLLRTVPPAEQSAEWYFLMGCVLYKRGYFLDAQKMFDHAAKMDPYNTEYAAARDRLREQAQTYGTDYRTASNPGCGCCTSLCLADCCCECLGGDLIRCC